MRYFYSCYFLVGWSGAIFHAGAGAGAEASASASARDRVVLQGRHRCCNTNSIHFRPDMFMTLINVIYKRDRVTDRIMSNINPIRTTPLIRKLPNFHRRNPDRKYSLAPILHFSLIFSYYAQTNKPRRTHRISSPEINIKIVINLTQA